LLDLDPASSPDWPATGMETISNERSSATHCAASRETTVRKAKTFISSTLFRFLGDGPDRNHSRYRRNRILLLHSVRPNAKVGPCRPRPVNWIFAACFRPWNRGAGFFATNSDDDHPIY
jgi:hypothetical protein